MRRLSAREWKSSRKFSNHLRSYVYGTRLFKDNVQERDGLLICYCLQESGGLVRERWRMSVTEKWPYASNARRSGPADWHAPLELPFPPHARRAPSFLARRRFKWNEMANCGDAYVFFDPLGSSESMLASDSQPLERYNGCQEVVSKGGLDRFVRPTRSSITLTFNTLGATNENHQLSRGSKTLNARQYVSGKISLCQGVEK